MSTVLIVDDEPEVRENLSDLLENVGYRVISAADGSDALRQLSKEIPSLVISDIMMPGMNGYELLERLQCDPWLKPIPFILLSAKADKQSFRKAMLSGADDYITKPYDAEELIRSVRVRLEKRKSHKTGVDEIIKNILLYVPHELRTPLVSILGFTDLITNDFYSLSSDEICEMIGRIKASGSRLHKTIEKFITLCDLTCSTSYNIYNSLESEYIDNPESLIRCIAFNKAGSYNRSRDLNFDLCNAQVLINEKHVEHIISEIIENALKFSYEGTPIEIKSFVSGDNYIISVKDYGKGMTSRQISAVSAFMQFGRATNQQEGNGLGLIISKKAAELSGGRLEIESVASAYTVINIYLKLLVS
ncbi:MAG: response regulator [Bacillota bacterium]